ncbi:hypothetical protein Tsubulata_043817, partial [Turnera subulata]
ARGLSQEASGFKNSVIFLFNTGEEEGQNGAHSFVTQHPWSDTIRLAVDLEALGIGGKSGIFQAGPDSWGTEKFASAAKYPSGNVIAQDLFSSGVIKSATDFQVYNEVSGLSGLDFAYTDNTAVYHTKNDKVELLKPGSLQHLGENMLPFLLQAASSSELPERKTLGEGGKTGDESSIFFDILGIYMVVYRQGLASTLYNSVIILSLLIWGASILMGGYPAAISLGLSCLAAFFMWFFSIFFSLLVAFILPKISPSPVQFVAQPWVVIGLFAAPALVGALTGQHLGYVILERYLSSVYSSRKQLSTAVQDDLAKLEAERWLFKAGAKQTLVVATSVLFGISLLLVLSGTIPPYTEDTARPVNVVHVVEAITREGKQDVSSYISLFSPTPGELTSVVETIDEGFVCGRDKVVDFVTFQVKYGCWADEDSKDGWSVSDIHIPLLHVNSDIEEDERITEISIDTKASIRWSLAINFEEIEDFILKGNSSEELVPLGNKSSTDGWHIIQFSGGGQSPRKFELTLFWARSAVHSAHDVVEMEKTQQQQQPLLKLRTDSDILTPKVERVLEKLPAWCSLFGKSTYPHTLAFLSALPVEQFYPAVMSL